MPSVIVRVVHVGVHVPDEVRRHRHEAGAALAQPAGQQQQLAERLGVVDVVACSCSTSCRCSPAGRAGRCRSGRRSSASSFDRSNASPTPPSSTRERLLAARRRCPAAGGVERRLRRGRARPAGAGGRRGGPSAGRSFMSCLQRAAGRPARTGRRRRRTGRSTRTCRSSSCPAWRRGSTARGNRATLVGMPVVG